MTRCVVKYNKLADFVNIPANRIEVHDGFVYVMDGTELAGMFDMGVIDMAYITEDKSA